MYKLFLLLVFLVWIKPIRAQDSSKSATRLAIGIAAPELLHVAFGFDIGKINTLCFGAGLGPSWGTVWPTLNAEHRLYFGERQNFTNRKRGFFRQGVTRFTQATNETALSFTLGADLKSKSSGHGWTIDLGGFVLFQNQYEKR
ncbi:MAG: hypothetical protein WKF70_06800, partial [Chitinophagaceae bacterium]